MVKSLNRKIMINALIEIMEHNLDLDESNDSNFDPLDLDEEWLTQPALQNF